MTRTGFIRFLAVLIALLAIKNGCVEAADVSRCRYLGSSNISMPTGYLRGETTYISDDGHNMVMYDQQAMGKLMEFSLLRHMNDNESGKNILNFKLNILEEGGMIPNVVWGVGDAGMSLGSRVFYLAGSKTFESYAVTVHGGFVKEPVTTEKKTFFGIEKTILPLVILAGEHTDGITSYGIKMRPYPGVSLEYSRRDEEVGGDADIYKIQYIKSY